MSSRKNPSQSKSTSLPILENQASSEDQPMSRRTALRAMVTAAAAATAIPAKSSYASDFGYAVKQVQKGPQKSYMNGLKNRAANDYTQSLQAYGGRLSDSVEGLLDSGGGCPHFSVLIIGSGYGASICAARLAPRLNHGHRLAVIERGREWVPGTFPDNFQGLVKNAMNAPWGRKRGHRINPLGLFNLSLSDEVNTLSANALGGTSILNANVALKPDSEIFSQKTWPTALRDRRVLDPYYEMAARSLNLQRTPYDQTSKVRVRREAAARISKTSGIFRSLAPRSELRSSIPRRSNAKSIWNDSASLQPLRRLHYRLQRGRQKHTRYELPSAGEIQRCRDLYTNRGQSDSTLQCGLPGAAELPRRFLWQTANRAVNGNRQHRYPRMRISWKFSRAKAIRVC